MLQVETVLEGSVRRWGDRIRVTAQINSAADGFHLWSETYDRELTDIFAIQDDIAGAIVKRLLQPGSVATRGPVTTISAFDLYLLARHHFSLQTPDAWQKARDLFEQSVAADPLYAPAWAGLATVLVYLSYFTVARASELQPRAREAADRALDLDSSLPDAHLARGAVCRCSNSRWQKG